MYFPTAPSVWVHVKFSDLPAASSVVPGGVTPSQPVSLRAANLSGTLPVFVTTTLYSTVCPSEPVILLVV